MATTTKSTTTATSDAKKDGPTSEHKLRMRVGRTIGRGVWMTGFKAENPNATKEERRAAWYEVQKDFTKIGMKALKTLEKTGYQVIEKPE
ncbi:hypothetical protein Q4555_03980 [Octadecabacter sp. 1_MG-2023]|uniref:hypothetical protein n=1 Tax=unclassified Octadecabacter TaxID=196158 RepID=UPI001C08D073|nr:MULTISPECIES: hypothetical protein [unclassified Octadecabacter]MBU2992737.1 hypothetical protein [Octadecabacter sp. B2R22]MDO6733812.1 hypothetical protein [Octadecabacter sp. 1_MG-2023]